MELLLNVYIFVLGLIIGSFLNVVIYRLPNKLSISKGRSMCPSCNHTLNTLDLFPVFSYIFLKGKCRYCGTKISLRYPVIELITGVSYLLIYLHYGLSIETIVFLILTSLLIVITMIDYDTMEINDRMHIFIIILALFNPFHLPILDLIIGFFSVSVFMFIIAYLTNGFGGGDIKLMAAIGLLLGYKLTILSFLIGIVLGAFIAIILLGLKIKKRSDYIPFGPALCLGIYIAILYGNKIIDIYTNLF